MRGSLVVGNWKMHGNRAEAFDLASMIVRGVGREPSRAEVALAPPYTALHRVREAIAASDIRLAAQDAHWQDSGAFTGEVSPEMVREAGCSFVILGHSERRHIFHESDQIVARKVVACLDRGLRPILCIGETLNERRKGITARVISRQLRIALKGVTKSAIENIEIAYEPVWAIGTGHNATPEQISHVHLRIRKYLVAAFGEARGGSVRILYGGSVKPDNAGELSMAPEVDGFLVGGASLRAETFLPIVSCFAIR